MPFTANPLNAVESYFAVLNSSGNYTKGVIDRMVIDLNLRRTGFSRTSSVRPLLDCVIVDHHLGLDPKQRSFTEREQNRITQELFKLRNHLICIPMAQY